MKFFNWKKNTKKQKFKFPSSIEVSNYKFIEIGETVKVVLEDDDSQFSNYVVIDYKLILKKKDVN